MDKDTSTISAPFLKGLDPEFQRFLTLVDRLESDKQCSVISIQYPEKFIV